ncbi:MAG: potassium transporter KtrB [Oscillospiraceae bacterium]|nr:potassium transporter KtrB [Oscillospiraceae bacterium]
MPKRDRSRKISLSTTQIILLSFLAVIGLGSGLLALPVSAADGVGVAYVDALFTATTAVCVTGLTVLPTVSAWSVFGQTVILLLVQIGGLGVITILSGMMIALQRRIDIGTRVLIQDAFNLNGLSGIVRFVKRVLLGTLTAEAAGAVLYMLAFVPRFGAKGIWMAVFTAVSAFCNAGLDIFGEQSLCAFGTDPLVCGTTCALVILGGLGFPVWWDVLRICRHGRGRGLRRLRELSLHSKIALSVTAALLAAGTAAFFVLERTNPQTLAPHSLFDQLQLAFFQSVTTRTAGFYTLPQQDLTNASAFVSLLLMFIGGSPAGTAGGIKTVTAAVLTAYTLSMVHGKNEVGLWGRSITRQTLSKAVAVTAVSFATVFFSTVLLAAVTDAPALDILYETVSAAATVGLTRNLTPQLTVWGKLIVTCTMYLGRVGPISLAVAFGTGKAAPNIIRNPIEDISVG